MTPADPGFDRDEHLRHESTAGLARPVGSPVAPGPGETVPSAEAAERGRRTRRGRGGRGGASGAGPQTGGGFAAAVRELVVVTVLALVISFVVKTWLLQPFWIPSGSMEDTLRIKDRVVVSKLTPGPFTLKRGDIVVFEDPANWLNAEPVRAETGARNVLHKGLIFVGLMPDTAENNLIKRVIGLPGDKVACCAKDGRLTVNGAPISEPYVLKGNKPSEIPFSITVPQGRVWVMGDHRSDSSDSRFHDPDGTGKQGSVPMDHIVGRASVIVWPLSRMEWLSRPSAVFAKVPAPS